MAHRVKDEEGHEGGGNAFEYGAGVKKHQLRDFLIVGVLNVKEVKGETKESHEEEEEPIVEIR